MSSKYFATNIDTAVNDPFNYYWSRVSRRMLEYAYPRIGIREKLSLGIVLGSAANKILPVIDNTKRLTRSNSTD